MVRAATGEHMSAMTIFTMAFRFLKEQVMSHLSKWLFDFLQSDVFFIVVVPPFLNAGSRQNMKAAAIAVSFIISFTFNYTSLLVVVRQYLF